MLAGAILIAVSTWILWAAGEENREFRRAKRKGVDVCGMKL